MRWRPADRTDRQLVWLWTFVTLAALALFPIATGGVSLWPACVFRAMTGVACPGCGSTRAILALGNGHVVEAVQLNPLFTAAVVGFVVLGLLAPWWTLAAGRLPVVTRVGVGPRLAAVAVVALNWGWIILRGV